MAKHILRATPKTWDEVVIKAKGLVLVEFWAMWCSPCRELVSMIKEITEEYADKLTVVKVDKEECEDIADQYNVMGVPTFIFFKNSERIGKIVGIITKEQLVKSIKEYL
jgi:thioredoxin 1